MPNLIEIRE